MLSGSIFSAVIGKYLPGAILIEKTLRWKRPVYAGDSVRGLVTVTKTDGARVFANLEAYMNEILSVAFIIEF